MRTFTTNNYILIEINNLMESSGLKDSPLKLLMIIISVYVTKTIFQLIITFQQKAIVTTLIKNLSNKLFQIIYKSRLRVFYKKQ